MSTEHEQQQESHPPEHKAPYQENPTAWTGGEVFSAILHEEQRDGDTHFSVEVFDGKEVVLFDFRGSVRSFATRYLSPGEVVQSEQPASQREPTPQTIPTATETPRAVPEKEKKPTKIIGTITQVHPLKQTQKQGRPMLFFTLLDTVNAVDRRVIAFDSIAEQLASPETNLQPDQPISLFAWKHNNKIHISGQERTVEDWYVQSAVYNNRRFEKPKEKQGTKGRTAGKP